MTAALAHRLDSLGAAADLRDPVRVEQTHDATSWDTFVAAHPDGTVEHLFAWHDIFRDVFGQSPIYLTATRGTQVIGVLPLVCVRSLILGRQVVSLPYASYSGLLCDDAAATDALVERARQIASAFGARRLELRNIGRHVPYSQCRTHKVGARLDLPRTVDALWTALDRKVRNQIRRAQKESLTVERGGANLVEDFYTVFTENMRDLGTPVFPKALFARAADLHGASVFVVRKDGVPVAASVTLTWRGRTLVPRASALRRYRQLSPNMLLYWGMLEAAVTDGASQFDFGRSTSGGGTHDFKLQWGAQDFPLHWETIPVDDRSAPSVPSTASSHMDRLVQLWQRMPLPIANTLGPRLIRHIV